MHSAIYDFPSQQCTRCPFINSHSPFNIRGGDKVILCLGRTGLQRLECAGCVRVQIEIMMIFHKGKRRREASTIYSEVLPMMDVARAGSRGEPARDANVENESARPGRHSLLLAH